MQSFTKLAITGSIIASMCCVMLTAEEEGRTLTNEDLISYSYHPDTKGDGTASDWEESNQYKSDHASDGRYDGNGDKKVSTINTPMKTIHRIGTYNHTVIEGGTIIRKYTGGRDEEKARAGQYAKSADDYFTSPVDEEGLPAIDQQQQIDAWKARHAGGTAYRGDGEKVEIEVRLPTKVVYTKPAPPPPPPPGGGGGSNDDKVKKLEPWGWYTTRTKTIRSDRIVTLYGFKLHLTEDGGHIGGGADVYAKLDACPLGDQNVYLHQDIWNDACGGKIIYTSVWKGEIGKHYRKFWFKYEPD